MFPAAYHQWLKLRLWPGLMLLLCLFAASGISAQTNQTLRLGIFPYLSSSQLFKTHVPLAEYLQRQLGVELQLQSAADFSSFVERTAQAEFDLVLTAPHMGRLAEAQSGYQPIVVSSNQIAALFVSRVSGPISSVSQLPGKRLVLPPKQAIISELALDYLRQAGLKPGQIQIEYAPSHNGALLTLQSGKADVAVFDQALWKTLNSNAQQRLRRLALSQGAPGVMILANPYVELGQVEKIRQMLLKFADTNKGKAYFDNSKLEPFRLISDEDMEFLTPYVERIFDVPMR